jgi:hypothetical protein
MIQPAMNRCVIRRKEKMDEVTSICVQRGGKIRESSSGSDSFKYIRSDNGVGNW